MFKFALIFALVALSASCVGVQWSEHEPDLALLEVGYRILLSEAKPTETIFLSAGYDAKRDSRIDPPLEVFSRLKDLGIKLRPVSEADETKDGVVERGSGKKGPVLK